MASHEIVAETSGSVWKIEAPVGTTVAAGATVLILESMKMEVPVAAPAGGIVCAVRVGEGDLVQEGDCVALIES